MVSARDKMLRDWLSSLRVGLPSATPMEWKDRKDHIEVCYLYANKTAGPTLPEKKKKRHYTQTILAQRLQPPDEHHIAQFTRCLGMKNLKIVGKTTTI
ncbi:hypothetical protein EVAR_55841_1 [Eumeta japonica]|uniref:Uncharacterized protein n=1 Tax=Eumeta variegata TaxID=151549 RepID=A0A4C1Z7R5_EUMVA|nr:hypothetical protein EVAR_55841_1 [Eumeta japonica]